MTKLDGPKYSCYNLCKMDANITSLLVAAQVEETRRKRMRRKQEYLEYRHLQWLHSGSPGLRLRPREVSVPESPGWQPVVPLVPLVPLVPQPGS